MIKSFDRLRFFAVDCSTSPNSNQVELFSIRQGNTAALQINYSGSCSRPRSPDVRGRSLRSSSDGRQVGEEVGSIDHLGEEMGFVGQLRRRGGSVVGFHRRVGWRRKCGGLLSVVHRGAEMEMG